MKHKRRCSQLMKVGKAFSPLLNLQEVDMYVSSLDIQLQVPQLPLQVVWLAKTIGCNLSRLSFRFGWRFSSTLCRLEALAHLIDCYQLSFQKSRQFLCEVSDTLRLASCHHRF